MMLVTMAAGRDEGLGCRAGSILSWLSVAAAIYGGLYLEPGVSGGGVSGPGWRAPTLLPGLSVLYLYLTSPWVHQAGTASIERLAGPELGVESELGTY